MKLSEYKIVGARPSKPEICITRGMKFKLGNNICILASGIHNSRSIVCLVDINTGIYWSDLVPVENNLQLSRKEVLRVFGVDYFREWEVVE